MSLKEGETREVRSLWLHPDGKVETRRTKVHRRKGRKVRGLDWNPITIRRYVVEDRLEGGRRGMHVILDGNGTILRVSSGAWEMRSTGLDRPPQ